MTALVPTQIVAARVCIVPGSWCKSTEGFAVYATAEGDAMSHR